MTTLAPVLSRVGDFGVFLGLAEDQQATRLLRGSEKSGRPVGDTAWVAALERRSGRNLLPQKRGPKKLCAIPVV